MSNEPLGVTILDEKGEDKLKPPPKATGGTPKANAGPGRPSRAESNVNAALATLEGIYALLGMVLEVAAPEAKAFAQWDTRVAAVQEKNKASLTASPKLAETIAKIGGVGGTGSFIAANLLTFAPVVGLAALEIRAKVQGFRGSEVPED